MRYWSVVSGLVADERGLLLVANKRRGGSVDWSTPGGVVDEGETSVGALTREITEETGLSVSEWGSLAWTVEVDFVDLAMHLDVEVHAAESFDGSIALEDPDGIVTAVEFMSGNAALERLEASPLWVSEPLRSWIVAPWESTCHFAYLAHGTNPATMSAERRTT